MILTLQIEYTIVRLDHENKVAYLALVGPETLDKIHEEEKLTSPEYLDCWGSLYKYLMEIILQARTDSMDARICRLHDWR